MILDIVNWQNAHEQSSNFKNHSPTKWTFVKEFLNRDFYEELYNTFPKLDNTCSVKDSYDTLSYQKFWKRDQETNLIQEYDSRYSESWNKFLEHLWSKEFIKKLVEVTGVEVTGLRHFCFMYANSGCYQKTHIHNVSDKTLIVFLYFSKNWESGDPGGTYLSDTTSSKILFEPYDLDNTALFVLDGPEAAHGMRKIVKDVERRAIQLTYEPFSTTEGWYGKRGKAVFEPIEL